MPESQLKTTGTDYAALVRFLVQPFLESPNSLKVDCEQVQSQPKVWLRVAIDGEEKGRVFGRGGRNIQAIRTVLEASARLAGFSLYLDIYGSQSDKREIPSPSRPPAPRVPRTQSRRPDFPSRSSKFRSP